MAPFQYSQLEQQYIEEGGKVFPHIMGTDEMGRDYFVRVIYGTRVSLAVGLFASIIVLIIGVLYGSISGYFGGKVDLIMMRIVDIIYSLPDMLMVILLSVVLRETLNVDAIPFLQKLGPNMISMFIVFGLLYWTGMARMVRGQILTIKQNEYVLAAKISRRKIRKDHPQTYSSQLCQRNYCSRRSSDSVSNFYREFPELYRTWRTGSDAFSWISGKCRTCGSDCLSL